MGVGNRRGGYRDRDRCALDGSGFHSFWHGEQLARVETRLEQIQGTLGQIQITLERVQATQLQMQGQLDRFAEKIY